MAKRKKTKRKTTHKPHRVVRARRTAKRVTKRKRNGGNGDDMGPMAHGR